MVDYDFARKDFTTTFETWYKIGDDALSKSFETPDLL